MVLFSIIYKLLSNMNKPKSNLLPIIRLELLRFILLRTVGTCVLPLIAWLLADWYWLVLSTSLPLSIMLIGFFFVPESPRWLLSKEGKVPKATQILRKVAKTNGKPEPRDLVQRLTVRGTFQYWGLVHTCHEVTSNKAKQYLHLLSIFQLTLAL